MKAGEIFLFGYDIKSNVKVLTHRFISIVELNNQAKHAVDSLMEGERVHLIFDYVDDFPLERIVLEPGAKLRQTRRSIDLASAAGSRMYADATHAKKLK